MVPVKIRFRLFAYGPLRGRSLPSVEGSDRLGKVYSGGVVDRIEFRIGRLI